jgi:hypothetical protein
VSAPDWIVDEYNRVLIERNSAYAERDQLRAEVERLKFMERMAIKADAEAAAFLRALRRYGHHRNGCSKFPAIDDSNPCDCGLDEVLR